MTETTLTPKTGTIAGHTLTLFRGVRYVATRPMASRRGMRFPVTVEPAPAQPDEAEPVVLPDLSYDAANAFLNAFNNGAHSFDGRVWGEPAYCEICEQSDAEFEAVVFGTTTALCAGCRESGIENGTLDAADCVKGTAR